MLNLTFNHVNLFHAGQSGFRHQVVSHPSKLIALLELIAGQSYLTNITDTSHPPKTPSENFDMGYFVYDTFTALLPDRQAEGFLSIDKIKIQEHFPDHHSPPPKATSV